MDVIVIKKEKTSKDLESELKLYKALYFRERKQFENDKKVLKEYEYLLPDEYRSLIKELLKLEGINYHE